MVFCRSQPFSTQARGILKLAEKNLVSQDYLEYQFIQKSQIPTSHFQSALPRLPIPKLDETCKRYLAAQKPLLSPDSYNTIKNSVATFKDGVGQQLQKALQDYDRKNKQTSYISEMWFDKYLRSRSPLPLNCNPVLVFNNDNKPEYNDRLTRATNLVISSLRFYKALNAQLLHPDIYHLNPRKTDTEKFNYYLSKLPPKLSYLLAFFNKAYPLDMSQYPNLFQSTRIPQITKDRLATFPDSKHITVQHKGHFYAFDVLTPTNDVIPAVQIMQNLRQILSDTGSANEHPVGLLTTLGRDKWASIRPILAQNGNQDQLKYVDSALFNLCLDEEAVGNDPYKVTKQFLHGDGTNRWFDKSFSLILSKDGVSAVNFEHAWGDGVAVLRYAEDVLKDSESTPRVQPGTEYVWEQAPQLRRLDFNLNDRLKDDIDSARRQYEPVCDNLDVNYTIFEGIGKKTCKINKVSPDAIMQLGFQVAYHKVYSKFVSTYESCSTAAFKHGRTEAIRPCTSATKDFTLAINSKDRPSSTQLMKMIKECSDVHNRLIKEAAMGQGFDRHLYALKVTGEKNQIKSPIFYAPEYSNIGYDVLSTSTLNSPAIFAGGFGPVVPDGFGLGYVIKDEFVGSLVTNYKDRTNGPEFISALTEAFEDIFAILKNNK